MPNEKQGFPRTIYIHRNDDLLLAYESPSEIDMKLCTFQVGVYKLIGVATVQNETKVIKTTPMHK